MILTVKNFLELFTKKNCKKSHKEKEKHTICQMERL